MRDRQYFQVDLLPRAGRRVVRDRDDAARLPGRRAGGRARTRRSSCRRGKSRTGPRSKRSCLTFATDRQILDQCSHTPVSRSCAPAPPLDDRTCRHDHDSRPERRPRRTSSSSFGGPRSARLRVPGAGSRWRDVVSAQLHGATRAERAGHLVGPVRDRVARERSHRARDSRRSRSCCSGFPRAHA